MVLPMQALERDLCALLNTLAALLLRQAQPGAKPPAPSAKGKGKAKQKAAATDGVLSMPVLASALLQLSLCCRGPQHIYFGEVLHSPGGATI